LELAFEHRNYLPSLGIILGATDLVLAGTGSFRRYRRLIAVVAVGSVSALTFLRAQAWSEAEQIYATAIGGRPPSVRARVELAQRYIDRGATDEARRLLAGQERFVFRLQTIYIDCLEIGRVAPAALAAAQSGRPDAVADYDASGLILLANLSLDGGCAIPQRNLLSLLEAVSTAPRMLNTRRQKLWMYAAHLRHALGDGDAALAALDRAFQSYPGNPVPLLLAAHWSLDVGNDPRGRSYYERARKAPTHPRLNVESLFVELENRLAR
jgi:hypothetical protein